MSALTCVVDRPDLASVSPRRERRAALPPRRLHPAHPRPPARRRHPGAAAVAQGQDRVRLPAWPCWRAASCSTPRPPPPRPWPSGWPGSCSATTCTVGQPGPGAATLLGHGAEAALAAAGLPVPAPGRAGVAGPDLVVHRTPVGFDLVGPAAAAAVAGLERAGAERAPAERWELARVEHGLPRAGRELTDDVLAEEAGLLGSHVHLDKGCYPGQETVARVHNLGQVQRRLAGLRFQPPPAGAAGAGRPARPPDRPGHRRRPPRRPAPQRGRPPRPGPDRPGLCPPGGRGRPPGPGRRTGSRPSWPAVQRESPTIVPLHASEAPGGMDERGGSARRPAPHRPGPRPGLHRGVDQLGLPELRARREEAEAEEADVSYPAAARLQGRPRHPPGRAGAPLGRGRATERGRAARRLCRPSLTGDSPGTFSAVPRVQVPSRAGEHRRRVERLVSDETIARLPELDVEELTRAVEVPAAEEEQGSPPAGRREPTHQAGGPAPGPTCCDGAGVGGDLRPTRGGSRWWPASSRWAAPSR